MNRRPAWLAIWLGLCAIALAVLAIGPALWLLLIALQPAEADMNDPFAGLTLRNFIGAFSEGRGLAEPLVNSVLVTLFRAGLNVLLAALAAYPLSRMRFRGRDTLFVLILATMMIPEQVIVVPMFRIVVSMGLYDTLTAVVLPFGVSAFGIYLCRQAFVAIPWEMEEAARIDGANALQTWWHVIVPLAAPTLATLALFSVIAAWSDLLWPLVVLQSEHKHTLPVAINELLGRFATNIRYAYAASVLSLIPIITLFIASQRFLKAGLFAGAVKG
ncbi:MAG: carbohydrate ABC transporter permease [Planctomycetota bacterium]